MSYKVSSNCVDRKFGSPTRKQIIMYLADKASDDGSGIWCSKGTIARECELGASTVKRIIAEFVRDKLLEAYGIRKHSNGFTKYYRIVVSNVLKLDKLKPKVVDTTQPFENPAQQETSCHPDARRQGVSKRDINNPESIHKPSISVSTEEKAAFEIFWKTFPDDRLRKKSECEELFIGQLQEGIKSLEIQRGAEAYVVQTKTNSRHLVRFSDNWLRDQDWRKFERETAKETMSEETRLKTLNTSAEWIKSGDIVQINRIPNSHFVEILTHGILTKEQMQSVGVSI